MIQSYYKKRILLCVCPIFAAVVLIVILNNQNDNTVYAEEEKLYTAYVEAYKELAMPIIETAHRRNNGELTAQEIYDYFIEFGQDPENINRYKLVNSCWENWLGYMDEHGIEYHLADLGNQLLGNYLDFDAAITNMQELFPTLTYDQCILAVLDFKSPETYLNSLLERFEEQPASTA